MTNENPSEAVMVVTVKDNMDFKWRFSGDPTLMPLLLGGMKYSEEWLMREMRVKFERKPTVDNETVPISLEVDVTKEQAIAMYWSALERMRDRLLAIDKADDQATFTVNPSLLSLL